LKWKVKNEKINQSKLVEQIYSARGVENYLDLFQLDEKDLYDPYLIRDMEKAVDRIMHAIENQERILVYGDYDVDGITSTFIVYKTLLDMGANVTFDIPNRFIDGYGLSYSKTYDIVNEEF